MADKIYNVKNRSTSTVVYRIPDDNLRRVFLPGEEKKISYTELEKLAYQAGGREIIANFLQVNEDEALDELDIHPEAEYFMNENQVIDLLKNGDLDAFLDCLDYAPIGVIDLIKTFSVSLPLTDTQKIAALKEKTGFDAAAALTNLRADAKEETVAAKPTASTRRTTPNYKVVKKSE